MRYSWLQTRGECSAGSGWNYFDGYALIEFAVGPLGKINGSHAATPDHGKNAVRAQALAVCKR